ncbi:MAG: hypothetical protein QOH96_1388 [Blastocatellia bacterium]|nr:hypothetical protein [Blastocatellia bacterium]
MNDDYLWDRSGEPDGEVAQLEELFQELRFDKTVATPPPFKLSVVPIRSRFSFPVKIAAGLVFLLLAGAFAFKLGGWSLRRNSALTKAVPSADVRAPGLPVQGPQASIPHDPEAISTPLSGFQPKAQKRILLPRRDKNTFNTRTDKIREGERAKAELMEAFRIASATLNQVQQKLAVNKDVRPSS